METTVVLCALAGFVLLGAVSDARAKRNELTLRRLERKVDLLLRQLGVAEPETEGLGEVADLVRRGKKIHAIKRYRDLTGAGLKEAKDAVERLV